MNFITDNLILQISLSHGIYINLTMSALTYITGNKMTYIGTGHQQAPENNCKVIELSQNHVKEE